MNNHTGTKYKLKERIVCRKCFSVFFNKSLKQQAQCPRCGRTIDARIRTDQSRIYNKKHPERIKNYQEYDKKNKKERGRLGRERVRKVVFNIISNNNPICFSCGCDDTRLLEVNHIKGGGNKELDCGKRHNVFMWDIYMGRRKPHDLNLLCRICNARHYLELKYGRLPFDIKYNANK